MLCPSLRPRRVHTPRDAPCRAGQTLLGVVRSPVAPMLGHPDRLAELPPQAATEPEGPWPSTPAAAQGEPARGPPAQGDSEDVLELALDGQVVAVGIRRAATPSRLVALGAPSPAAGDAEALVEVYKGGALVGCCWGCRVYTPGDPGAALRHSHSAVHLSLALNSILQWTAVGQGLAPLMVCRGTRTLLPPPWMWLFPPRDPAHTRECYYLEWPEGDRRQRLRDRGLWVDPEVLLLATGFSALDRERERVLRARAIRRFFPRL